MTKIKEMSNQELIDEWQGIYQAQDYKILSCNEVDRKNFVARELIDRGFELKKSAEWNDPQDYEQAYHILMEYYEDFPEDLKPEINQQLKDKCNL